MTIDLSEELDILEAHGLKIDEEVKATLVCIVEKTFQAQRQEILQIIADKMKGYKQQIEQTRSLLQ